MQSSILNPSSSIRRQAPPGGCSSAGRASALQAEGRRFDPDQLHQSPRSNIEVRGQAVSAIGLIAFSVGLRDFGFIDN